MMQQQQPYHCPIRPDPPRPRPAQPDAPPPPNPSAHPCRLDEFVVVATAAPQPSPSAIKGQAGHHHQLQRLVHLRGGRGRLSRDVGNSRHGWVGAISARRRSLTHPTSCTAFHSKLPKPVRFTSSGMASHLTAQHPSSSTLYQHVTDPAPHQQHVLARRPVLICRPRLADAKGRHRLQRRPAIQVQEVHVGVAVQHARHVQPAWVGSGAQRVRTG